MKILLADDEEIIRNGISKIIEKNFKGVKVILAKNGEESISLFDKYSPEIVMMDINMPKKDGLTVSEYIKNKNKNTKVIIISGYDNFDYTKKAILIGVDDYLLKPSTKDEIIEVIQRMLNKINEEFRKKQSEKILEDSIDNFVDDDKGLFNKINNLIEENYDKSYFSLNYLSSLLNMSNSYLSTFIKKNYGINFQNYILKKRMMKAAILLATTTLKMYEVAEKTGFESDGYYFNAKFKQYYNLTPGKYRKKFQKVDDEEI